MAAWYPAMLRALGPPLVAARLFRLDSSQPSPQGYFPGKNASVFQIGRTRGSSALATTLQPGMNHAEKCRHEE
jgi:hypothetical protein